MFSSGFREMAQYGGFKSAGCAASLGEEFAQFGSPTLGVIFGMAGSSVGPPPMPARTQLVDYTRVMRMLQRE